MYESNLIARLTDEGNKQKKLRLEAYGRNFLNDYGRHFGQGNASKALHMMMRIVDITTWPDHLPESVRNCLTLASLS